MPWISNGTLWVFPIFFLIYLWMFINWGFVTTIIVFLLNITFPFVLIKIFDIINESEQSEYSTDSKYILYGENK
jgi:hypothetical protein